MSEKVQVIIQAKIPEEMQQIWKDRLQEIADLYFTADDTIPVNIGQAHIIVGWQPREATLQAAQRCVLYQALAAGLGERQIALFRQFSHIQVTNHHGNAYATAQHAIALLFACLNRLIPYHLQMCEGKWPIEPDQPSSITLKQIPIGILGFGAIGSRIARFLSGFDCDIKACNRTGVNNYDLNAVTLYPIDELELFLHSIQILFVVVPLTAETRGMITLERLKLLQAPSIVINISRGAVIDERSLYEALRDGVLQAAGLDVWYIYNPESQNGRSYPYSYPFHELETVVLSPHRAASPLYALDRWESIFENIRRVAAGRRDFLHLVDLEQGY